MIAASESPHFEVGYDWADVGYNQWLASDIIERQIAEWTLVLKEPNSGKPPIRAEIQRLDRQIPLICQIIFDYRITELIDSGFVQDVDYCLQVAADDPLNDGPRAQLQTESWDINRALDDLRARNYATAEAV